MYDRFETMSFPPPFLVRLEIIIITHFIRINAKLDVTTEINCFTSTVTNSPISVSSTTKDKMRYPYLDKIFCTFFACPFDGMDPLSRCTKPSACLNISTLLKLRLPEAKHMSFKFFLVVQVYSLFSLTIHTLVFREPVHGRNCGPFHIEKACL